MSQDDLARALRTAGVLSASKRLVQRWESGTTGAPRPLHARALEQVTGLPIEELGFAVLAVAQPSGDSAEPYPATNPITQAENEVRADNESYSGIWLSRYEFFSTGRSKTLSSSHYVVLLQHGARLTVRSLPASAPSQLAMDLDVLGNVLTGTWSEQTSPDGYYHGARYHGAIQLLADPTNVRMTGKWAGFGKDFDINTGPWELTLQDRSTNKDAIERFSRPADNDRT